MTMVHELRGFQREILVVTYGLDDPSGQEILAEMQESLTEDIQAGRLYSNLDDLVELGLVEKTSTEGRENRYELTETGIAEIESRHEWERELIEDARER